MAAVSRTFICGNTTTPCIGLARSVCEGCFLVAYCGRECQKTHWKEHKSFCKATKAEFVPKWQKENRKPTFMAPDDAGPMARTQFGNFMQKYLWGNLAAFDVLALQENEGVDYDKKLSLLFAASGDIRNVLKTIEGLPSSQQPVEFVINDKDLDIVARNIILLLLALSLEDVEEAFETIVHVWYSAFISPKQLEILQTQIRPLISDVCNKIAGKDSGVSLGKTWDFNGTSIRVVLKKEDWMALLSYFEVPQGLDAEEALKLRQAVTLAPQRVDFRDRRAICIANGSYRVSMERFQTDGMLMPFAASRQDFNIPNPALYQYKIWPMNDSADPFGGWDIKAVNEAGFSPAKGDIYGKLYSHIRELVMRFRQQALCRTMSFRVLRERAEELAFHLADGSFDRIEVSNTADHAYLGLGATLMAMAPLLRPAAENPHATLITAFMNAVAEAQAHKGSGGDIGQTPELERAMKKTHKFVTSPGDKTPVITRSIKTIAGLDFFRDNEKHFANYMAWCWNVKALEAGTQVRMKKTNTIVDKWPMGLKLKHGQRGAQEEFDWRNGSAHSGQERYVEWNTAKGVVHKDL